MAIVDGPEIEVVRLLPEVPMIVIADDIGEDRERLMPGTRARVLLARPFNACTLLEQVDRLLHEKPDQYHTSR